MLICLYYLVQSLWHHIKKWEKKKVKFTVLKAHALKFLCRDYINMIFKSLSSFFYHFPNIIMTCSGHSIINKRTNYSIHLFVINTYLKIPCYPINANVKNQNFSFYFRLSYYIILSIHNTLKTSVLG